MIGYNQFPYYLIILCFSIIESIFWQIGVINIMSRGLAISETGVLLGHYFITFGLLSIPACMVGDRYNRKHILISGYIFLLMGSFFILNSIFEIGFITISLAFSMIYCCQKTLFLDAINKKSSIQRLKILTTFETIRRFGIGISAMVTWRLQIVSTNSPWYFWFILSTISAIIISYAIEDPKKAYINETRRIYKKIYTTPKENLVILSVFYFGIIFVGVEFGIRNIIFNPFLTEILNSGDISSLQTQGLVQSLAGLIGALFIVVLSKIQTSSVKICIGISFSLFLYAGLDYYASIANEFKWFMTASAIGVLGMGIFIPLKEEFILRHIDPKNRNLALGLSNSIQYLMAGLILYLMSSYRYDISDIRSMWKVGAACLIVSCSIYIFLAFYRDCYSHIQNINHQKEECNL